MQTLVSIMPFPFSEKKPGLTPGNFALPEGSVKEPSMLVVKEAKIRQMDQNFKYYLMDIPLKDVAHDVCHCYSSSQIGYGVDAMPGIFHVSGEYTAVEKLKEDHLAAILKADEKQRNWFRNLVKIADDEWALNPLHKNISDLHRAACRYLNLERAWLATETIENIRCPACKTIVLNSAAVCFACKAILKEEEHSKLKFAAV